MLRRLYDWTLGLAGHRHALWYLAVVSFAESSFFLITPLVMLAPMVLARPDRAWIIAGVCTAASVAGGVFGWFIGYGLYEELGRPLLEFYGKAEAFDELRDVIAQNSFELIFLAALTPIPYKAATIASGLAHASLINLILASILGRGIQFFAVAGRIYERAKAAGLGREIPTDWLLQDIRD